MKRIVLGITAGLVAFLIGLAGTFFVLPMLAPELAEQALDPAREAAEAEADTQDITDDSIEPAVYDAPDEADTTAVEGETPSAAPLPPGSVIVEEDSLQTLHDAWQAAQQERDRLEEELATLQEQLDEVQRRRTDMEELSGTLTRLQERELAPILEEMEMSAVRVLYEQASPRNRTRILQALPAQRAASFIDELVEGSSTVD